MIAQIKGFDTRADIGLRPPRGRSTNIDPSKGGVTKHGIGFKVTIKGHDDCRKLWRRIQDIHMDTNKWVDVAYNAAFCRHGFVLAGRGSGVRSAANGTTKGNYEYLAFVYLGSPDDVLTPEAENAMAWLVAEARQDGAGSEVRPHSFHKATSCPKPVGVERAAARLHRTNISAIPAKTPPPAKKATPAPTKAKETRPTLKWGSTGEHVRTVQRVVGTTVDGDFRSKTDKAVRKFQSNNYLTVDGIVGKKTWAAIDKKTTSKATKPKTKKAATPKKTESLKVDGIWGSLTTAAIQRAIGDHPDDGVIDKAFREFFQWTVGAKVDGIWGVKTRKALQKKLGVKQDGIWGPVTVTALQRALNKGTF